MDNMKSWQTNFHPKLVDWFAHAFKQPTVVQLQAWQAISQSQDVLIHHQLVQVKNWQHFCMR